MTRRTRPNPGPAGRAEPESATALMRTFEAETKTKSTRMAAEVPSEWLAALLSLACELPVQEGPEAVARTLVERVGPILQHDLTFGLSFSTPLDLDKDDGERFLRMPPQGSQVGLAPSAERLFPELGNERVLEMAEEDEGIRLHVASDIPAMLEDNSTVHRFVVRVADVLANALRTTRLLSEKRRESLELRGQIIQTEKLASLGQIAAGVVHELNNPLTSIVGYTDYLRGKAERTGGDPNDLERLRRIGEAAGRILSFSRDLIAYARPSTESPCPVALHAVADQALVFCEHEIAGANIRIERRFATDTQPVMGVRDQLTQVFVNLFTNACHAMEPHGGTLFVQTEFQPQRRTVKVTVADTGHGIDPVNLNRVFDPFFSTKTDGRGTGLGLSIVRNIVLLHGGAIAVESSPQNGTRFYLEFPIAP